MQMHLPTSPPLEGVEMHYNCDAHTHQFLLSFEQPFGPEGSHDADAPLYGDDGDGGHGV